MENLTLGQILVIHLFILLPLLNWLLARLPARRRAAGRAAEERSLPPVPVGAQKSAPFPRRRQ